MGGGGGWLADVYAERDGGRSARVVVVAATVVVVAGFCVLERRTHSSIFPGYGGGGQDGQRSGQSISLRGSNARPTIPQIIHPPPAHIQSVGERETWL